MSDANDNENRPGGRTPLTLKPRTGAVSSGTVKQSFSHGRSKTVVVETKRRRVDAPPAATSGPARPAYEPPKPQAQAPAAPRPAAPPPPLAGSNLNLSQEELRARQRVVETARAEQERQAEQRRQE